MFLYEALDNAIKDNRINKITIYYNDFILMKGKKDNVYNSVGMDLEYLKTKYIQYIKDRYIIKL